MSTTLHIAPAEIISQTEIQVPIAINTHRIQATGRTVITASGSHTWVETVLDGRHGDRSIMEQLVEESFTQMAYEIKHIRSLAMPMTTDDQELVGRVAHAIITNARPEW
ncbi:MAG: hypothetical protein Q4C81_04140 [Kocuria sp.]|nr:hypothetical protein [Kocuria sp.]